MICEWLKVEYKNNDNLTLEIIIIKKEYGIKRCVTIKIKKCIKIFRII